MQCSAKCILFLRCVGCDCTTAAIVVSFQITQSQEGLHARMWDAVLFLKPLKMRCRLHQSKAQHEVAGLTALTNRNWVLNSLVNMAGLTAITTATKASANNTSPARTVTGQTLFGNSPAYCAVCLQLPLTTCPAAEFASAYLSADHQLLASEASAAWAAEPEG